MSARLPEQITLPFLRQRARLHLERYWPSAEMLRRVLRRAVDKVVERHGDHRAAGYRMVDVVVDELVADGSLNDARFAAAWAGQLHRRGLPAPAQRARLREKGVAPELAAAAVTAVDEAVRAQGADPQKVRACAYVRRKRLGPFRLDPEARATRRDKDLAALGRAGFPWGLAKELIDADDTDEIDALADLEA